MSLAHWYPNFGSAAQLSDPFLLDPEPLEDLKLQAFEGGYQAGWDDAVRAHENEREKIAADLAQNFQDMSFTFYEAHARLTSAMKPLLEQMVCKLLPEIATHSLGGHVLQQLEKLMSDQTSDAIEIAVSPDNKESIKAILDAQIEMPFELVAEPALSSGQVYIRVGQAEREVNLDLVTSGISKALVAFFHQTEKDKSHG